jgi:hypothetical protein
MSPDWRRAALVVLLLAMPFARGGWRAQLLTGPATMPPGYDTLPPQIGQPIAGALEVRVIRRLLAEVPRGAHARVVLRRASVPDQVLTYLQYQLAHLEYPRQVPVVIDSSGGTPYGSWSVLGPDVAHDGALVPVAALAGYRLIPPAR